MGNFKLKITHQQKKVMFEFLKSKPELVCGKFTKKFTWKEAEEQWKQLTMILNSTPGPKKDWKSWRKTWHDLRCRSKWKAKKRENTLNDCNGNSATPEEEEILQLISPEALLQNEEEISFDFVEVIHNQDEEEDVDVQLNEPSTSVQAISTLIEGKPIIEECLSNNLDELPSFEEEKKYGNYKTEKTSFHKMKNSREGLVCYEKYLYGKLALKQKYQEEKLKIKMKKVENEERRIAVMEKIASAIEKIK